MDNSNYISSEYFDRSIIPSSGICDNQYYSGYTISSNNQPMQPHQHQHQEQQQQQQQQQLQSSPQHQQPHQQHQHHQHHQNYHQQPNQLHQQHPHHQQQIQQQTSPPPQQQPPQQQQQLQQQLLLTTHLDGNNYGYGYNQTSMPVTNAVIYNNYSVVINGNLTENQQHSNISTTTNPSTTTASATSNNNISATKDDSTTSSKPVKAKRKKKINRKKEPTKKSASAYAHFFRDMQARIKEENKSASFGDISKIVASKWDALSNDEKAIYKRKAEVAKNDQFKDIALSHALAVAGAKTNEVGINQLENDQIIQQNNLHQQSQPQQAPPPQQQQPQQLSDYNYVQIDYGNGGVSNEIYSNSHETIYQYQC